MALLSLKRRKASFPRLRTAGPNNRVRWAYLDDQIMRGVDIPALQLWEEDCRVCANATASALAGKYNLNYALRLATI
jgi:hypothetical protein